MISQNKDKMSVKENKINDYLEKEDVLENNIEYMLNKRDKLTSSKKYKIGFLIISIILIIILFYQTYVNIKTAYY